MTTKQVAQLLGIPEKSITVDCESTNPEARLEELALRHGLNTDLTDHAGWGEFYDSLAEQAGEILEGADDPSSVCYLSGRDLDELAEIRRLAQTLAHRDYEERCAALYDNMEDYA